ncbi:hypothetical protein [Amycolatopsis sp.]|uniref:hypothetical protein n=1 Tax=Amycolatopsis sp. TaxID=37632 RepID=UPI002D8016AF|nr:hypothetical protein [Amycolatopsis sp.]HET6708904.1 hypothetical protein [Amycolatopsis sp.]
MRVLVVGQGPVARVLATSVAGVHRVGFAVRERTAESRLVGTRRLRAARGVERRSVDLVTAGERAAEWDVVISTASPAAPGVAELLRQSAIVAAVTQVPSEVELLRTLAGDRPWGLVVPEFFAGGADPTWWWPPARVRFTVAGPASVSLRSLFAHPRWSRTAALSAPLVSAATTMPIVAGLHAAGFDLTAARRSARRLAVAATQARDAVAAGFDGPAPRPVSPHAVRVALAVLPRLAPFDVPYYLRSHFGGHGPQTVRMLRDWAGLGRRHGLPADEVEELLGRVSA